MAREFTELAVWQLANELRQLVFAITARPAAARDFKYCDQCKDAARSAASNIAEGFGRYQHRDFARFLRIAVGSLNEVRDLLMDGDARGYVTAAELAAGTRLVKRACAAAGRFIQFLVNTPDPE